MILRGRVVTPDGVIEDGAVDISGTVIADVRVATESDGPSTDSTILPGLVDVHCHGGGGESFPDSRPDSLQTAVRYHRRRGTTTMLASLVSASPEVLLERIDALGALHRSNEIAGIHLEGPFLAAARCGAQNPAALRPGDPSLLRDLVAAGCGSVSSVTLAPETACFEELATVLRDEDVLPSLGHTDADFDTTVRAVEILGDGPVSATHLFNAMPVWHHRAPGPVAACLGAAARGDIVLELIGDGVHLDDRTVRTVVDLVGPDSVAFVSDAMAAAGMPDGRYTLGSLDVTVSDRVARLSQEGGAIAGGTATALDVLRRSVVHAGLDVVTAVRAASTTPARLVGLGDRVGRIAIGYDADLVLVDPSFTVRSVMRAGAWEENQ